MNRLPPCFAPRPHSFVPRSPAPEPRLRLPRDPTLLRGWRAGVTRALCALLLVHFIGGPAAILRACDDDWSCDINAPEDCDTCSDLDFGSAGFAVDDPQLLALFGSPSADTGLVDTHDVLNFVGGQSDLDPGGSDPIFDPAWDPLSPTEPPSEDPDLIAPPASPPDPAPTQTPAPPVPENTLPAPSSDTPPDNPPPETPVTEPSSDGIPTPGEEPPAPVEEPTWDGSGAPPSDDDGWNGGGDRNSELADNIGLPARSTALALADDLGTWDGVNQFRIHDGNARRKIPELRIAGTVSQLGLSWSRINNTVEPPGRHHLGTAGNWRHSWQFDLVPLAPEKGGTAPRMTLVYPEGDRRTLTKTPQGPWISSMGFPERATIVNGNVDIETGNGAHLYFAIQRRADGKFRYNLQRVTDAHGEVTQLDYDTAGYLTKVTEVSTGRNLTLAYRQIASPQTSRALVARLAPKGAPVPARDTWVEVTVDPRHQATAWRHLRLRAHPTAAGVAIAEIQFFAPGSTVPLTGRVIGDMADAALAFDGNPTTAATGERLVNQGAGTDLRYVGLDFGTPTRVERIRVLTGANAPFGECAIEGLAVAPASVRVLTQVSTDDGRAVRYDYGVIRGQLDGVKDVALVRARYGDGTQAHYQYGYRLPAGYRPAMVEARDPRYAGRAKAVRYGYYPLRTEGYLGEIRHEASPVTGQVMVSREHDSYKDPTRRVVAYGDQRTIVYQMNAKGDPRVVKRVDELGRTDRWEFSGAGARATAHVSPNGRRTEIERDERGHISAKKDQPANQSKRTHQIVRDARGLTTTEIDRFGRTKSLVRDTTGRVTRIDHFDGRSEERTYDAHGRLLTHRGRSGATRRYSYDARGQLAAATDATGRMMRFGYNTYGQLVRTIDSAGRVTRYLRNERGQLTQRINPDGTNRSYSYDELGRGSSMTDELGRTIRRSLDHLGRVTRVVDAAGQITTLDYAELPNGCGACSVSNRPTRIHLPSGQEVTQLFDPAGRLLARTVGAGTGDSSTTTYGYDLDGNLVTLTDPKGRVSRFAYDGEGKIVRRTDPSGRATSFDYDAFNNLTAITFPDGRSRTLAYDKRGRLTRETDASRNTTRYAYNDAGDLTALVDAKGNHYGFVYDAQRRKTATIYPDGSREKWGYDATGRLGTYTTRAGQNETFAYDGRGRLAMVSWIPAGVAPNVVYEYDVANRLTAVDNGVARLSYTYDAMDRVLTETTRLSATVASGVAPQTVGYAYDVAGRRTQITYPDGTVVRYAFNARNQLSAVSRNGAAPLASYAYDVDGRVSTVTRENGVSTRSSYDSLGRLTGLSHQKGGSIAASSAYELDALGRRTAVTREDGLTERYRYDESDQLTGVDFAVGVAANAKPARTASYRYDSLGNFDRVTDSAADVVDYDVNGLNQYTRLHETGGGKPAAFSYDHNGNLVGVEGRKDSADAHYRYNALNQLVAAETAEVRTEFFYDARGRSVARRHSTSAARGGWTLSVSDSRMLCYDGWSLLAECRLDGQAVATYVHGARLDEVLARFAPDGKATYPLHDALGSTVALTDNRGTVIERYRYDAFGRPSLLSADYKTRTESTAGFRFLFTGREWLSHHALYDFRHRTYAPALGRFLQTDPASFAAQDVNLCRYAGNNPISFTDPLGLCEQNGGGLFSSVGNAFVNFFATAGGQTLDDVLDIGSAAATDAGKGLAGFTNAITLGAIGPNGVDTNDPAFQTGKTIGTATLVAEGALMAGAGVANWGSYLFTPTTGIGFGFWSGTAGRVALATAGIGQIATTPVGQFLTGIETKFGQSEVTNLLWQVSSYAYAATAALSGQPSYYAGTGIGYTWLNIEQPILTFISSNPTILSNP